MSHEESRWQNELKDLIWLELQAHYADRTPMAQDEYLCHQRESIDGLLKRIMEYRWANIFKMFMILQENNNFSYRRITKKHNRMQLLFCQVRPHRKFK